MAQHGAHGKRQLLPSSLLPLERTAALGNVVVSRPSRVLDAVVEELFPGLNGSRSDRHHHRITSILRFSLKSPATLCTTLLTTTTKSAPSLARRHPGTTPGLTAQRFPVLSTVNFLGREADSVMPASAPSSSLPAVAPDTSSTTLTATATTATTATATATATTVIDSSTARETTAATKNPTHTSSSSNPILKTRKSASQLAQRLSSWSVSSSASSQPQPPRPETSLSGSRQDAKLRSVSSNDSLGSSTSQGEGQRTSFLRRLSPGLAARVKLLDSSSRSPSSSSQRTQNRIGRIPEEQIRELDRLHRDLSIKVEKKGKAWVGSRQDPVFGGQLVAAGKPREKGQTQENTAVTASPATRETALTQTPTGPVDGANTMATPAETTHGTTENPPPLEQTDFEKYIRSSTEAIENPPPPPPPPKDSPPAPSGSTDDIENDTSYFNPLGLHRTDSIYSFSRASFSNQLSQLTSINLPQPSTLEASISAISTATAAVRALTSAAEQIQRWINKASEVLSGLDAEDDVEWAAAGGREGLDEVDKAVAKFENLINVYVQAIENVQMRNDIADVGAEQLRGIVTQMESTLKSWSSIRSQLKGVKEQVELAMEWEELWNSVLGDVGLEIENLSRLIFEMEEKRHKMGPIQEEPEPTSGLDINELETIVEETPANGNPPANSRFSIGPTFSSASSYLGPPTTSHNPQDEASLLALFARMQPLRASLDFLPMRLSMFQSRAEKTFPSACKELEEKRQKLELGYKKLEADAEALRRELGEDRWIIVFRNAGRQAHKMCESVERSVQKLREAIDGGIQHSNPTALAKRAENFEAKKVHYGSAIERVLAIIQKGINDRLTVNGEVIRLHADLKARFEALNEMMRDMDAILDELAAARSHQLRDSISSIVTLESPATQSAVDTPGSSPASSVIMPAGAGRPNVPSRRSSAAGSAIARALPSKLKRFSALPQPAQNVNQSPRRSSFNRTSSSTSGLLSPTTPRLRTTSPSPTITPRPASRISSTSGPLPIESRPRWNSSTNTNDLIVGHHYKPLSSTTPCSHRKASTTSRTSRSSLQARSPLSRESSTSPAPGLRPPSRLNRGLASSPAPAPDRHRDISPSPARPSLIDPPPYSKLRKQTPTASAQPSPSSLPSAPRSRQSYGGNPSARLVSSAEQNNGSDGGTGSGASPRPGTALGHSSRRSSLLPLPKARATSGRESSLASRPPWR
ncbi:hypothetical protein VTO42DRAFT_2362 [Malbranchea cinnamomea]